MDFLLHHPRLTCQPEWREAKTAPSGVESSFVFIGRLCNSHLLRTALRSTCRRALRENENINLSAAHLLIDRK